jgi:DNA (cytosine-5)-methyltransferase 1
MKALDLFCKAGGASKGLSMAGFIVTGIDIEFQNNYPWPERFIQKDALTITTAYLREFDFIWASPPCQAHSVMRRGRWQDRKHPDLIAPVRKMLMESGVPYCIENVCGAPLVNPIMLCGSMFGLQTKHGSQLRRHRLFECSFFVRQPECKHNKGSVIGVYGGGQHPGRRIPATIGVYGNSGCSSNRDGLQMFGTQDRRDAMGIQWMTGKELSQAIPPAYSKYIAEQFLKGCK